ncbi:hypothetical protein LIA77_10550 [Sarocladium implicatum]|nr:hypothetical protein LIA77_10550 [Sarocladium implicatum]
MNRPGFGPNGSRRSKKHEPAERPSIDSLVDEPKSRHTECPLFVQLCPEQDLDMQPVPGNRCCPMADSSRAAFATDPAVHLWERTNTLANILLDIDLLLSRVGSHQVPTLHHKLPGCWFLSQGRYSTAHGPAISM